MYYIVLLCIDEEGSEFVECGGGYSSDGIEWNDVNLYFNWIYKLIRSMITRGLVGNIDMISPDRCKPYLRSVVIQDETVELLYTKTAYLLRS
jgi:hypothetical protein